MSRSPIRDLDTRTSAGAICMRMYDEKYLATPVASWAQRLAGAILLLATLATAWYIVPSLTDRTTFVFSATEFWFDLVILVLSVFALTLSAKLLRGKSQNVELVQPWAMIAAGLVVVAGGILALATARFDHIADLYDGLTGLLLGGWMIRFGMKRWRNLVNS